MTAAARDARSARSRSRGKPDHVAVIGAGAAGLAAAHALVQRDVRVTVLEATPRAGGAVATTRDGDWLVEHAANGFVDRDGFMGALVHDLGLDKEIVHAGPAHAERAIVHRGRLAALPRHPAGLASTPLLTPREKWRVAAEIVQPARAPRDESVASFVTRRFGAAVAPFADAFVTGTTGGDSERASAAFVLPRLVALERDGGSVLRGLARGGGSGRPLLASCRAGLSAFTQALADALPPDAKRFLTPAVALRRDGALWVIETDGAAVTADAVVVAVPPRAAAALTGIETGSAPQARLRAVGLGYAATDAPGARGFGYLAPATERRFALGAVFESNLFPHRAPPGHVLVRALVGGARDPVRAGLHPEELVRRVHEDLVGLGVVTGAPVFHAVPPPGTLPQMDVGHDAVLRQADRFVRRHGGVRFVGAGWRHVAMAALIGDARDAAGALARGAA